MIFYNVRYTHAPPATHIVKSRWFTSEKQALAFYDSHDIKASREVRCIRNVRIHQITVRKDQILRLLNEGADLTDFEARDRLDITPTDETS